MLPFGLLSATGTILFVLIIQPFKPSMKTLNNTEPKTDSCEIWFICLTGVTANHQ